MRTKYTVEATELLTPHSKLSWKRASDFVLAACLCVASAPLFVLAALAVRLTSAGPVVYAQTRSGRGRRPFTIYKIRTMYNDCERLTGPRWSTDNDPRVTPVGRFLRKTHLDELPQLWNVLRGDMSLVGPRPERPEFVSQLERAVPRYAERLDVPPGLTGLAQVNLPPDSDHESVRNKLAYDLHYVAHASAWLDARIMLATGFFLLGLPFAATTRLLSLRPFPESDAGAGVESSRRSRPAEVGSGLEMVSTAFSGLRDG